MPEAPTIAQPPVEARHVAAAVTGEKSTNAEIKTLVDLLNQRGAKGMFQQEALPDENVPTEPRFDELKKTADKETDATKKANLTDKLDKYKEITEGTINDPNLKLVAEVMSTMPGFVSAVAAELKSTNMADVVNKIRIMDPTVKPILERMAKDEKFVKRFKRVLGEIEVSEDMDTKETAAEALKSEVTTKQATIDAEKKVYTDAQKWYNDSKTGGGPLTPADLASLENDVMTYELHRMALQDPNLPRQFLKTDISKAQLPAYLATLKAYITATFGVPDVATLDPTTIVNVTQKNIAIATKNAYLNAESMQNLYTNPYFTEANVAKLRTYAESDQKIAGLDAQQQELNKKKIDASKAENAWKKALEKYERRIEIALDKAAKGYYNEVTLKEAADAAMAEALKKEEGKTEGKTKEEQARELVKKYMRLAYLKYGTDFKTGRQVPKGWDDEWIKTNAKAIKSLGPEGIAKVMIQKIMTQKGFFPPEVQTALLELTGKINPADPNNPLAGLSSDALRNLGAELAPQLLGYAQSRGYWSDRIKFSKPEAEMMRALYGEEFWTKALQNKTEFQQQADEIFGKGVLNLGEGLNKDVKNLMGRDWPTTLKKLLKLLAILGIVGAVFVAGPGLIASAKGLTGP